DESVPHVTGASEAIVSLLGDRAADDVRQAGGTGAADRRRRLVEDAAHGLVLPELGVVEEAPAADQLPEDHAEGVDVGASVGADTGELLRRHVGDLADEGARLALVARLAQAGDA